MGTIMHQCQQISFSKYHHINCVVLKRSCFGHPFQSVAPTILHYQQCVCGQLLKFCTHPQCSQIGGKQQLFVPFLAHF